MGKKSSVLKPKLIRRRSEMVRDLSLSVRPRNLFGHAVVGIYQSLSEKIADFLSQTKAFRLVISQNSDATISFELLGSRG